MSETPSFFDSLLKRRVLQIVGMYIAATWLVIEVGDWTTERFGLPQNLTSYVFIAMLVMLPAVALFAWNHGAPGRDRWTATEKVAIPANTLLALAVLYFVSPMLDVEAATETVQIQDETGAVQEFEVVRQGYHQDVLAYFWENESGDPELDWLAYGLPLLLAHDLNRVSPVITVDTPLTSTTSRDELVNRGYPSLLDAPRGLVLEIARNRGSAALIVGSFAEDGGTRMITATVVDAETGNEIGSHSVSGNDWLTAVDDVTTAVLDYLDIEPSDNQTDDPVAQHFSDSIDAIRYFTNGLVAIDVNNDYAQGIAQLQGALQEDPAFAEAGGALSMAHYLSGDVESAKAAANDALRNSYRLSETSKFVLKANRYIFDGEFERGGRVLDIWTQVQPNSTEAWSTVARLSKMRGSTEGLDKASAAYDRLLELDPGNARIYRDKADVELQRGDYAAAARYLSTFLENEPDNGDAHRQLAFVYQAQGDLDAAQEALEDAAILSDDPLVSELGLARLEARRGLWEDAERRLASRLDDQLSAQQRIQVLSAQMEVAMVRGELERALELHTEISELAEGIMPPILRLVSVENQRAGLLALVGRIDEAVRLADEIVAQLQPPTTNFMNFTYTSIYESADDRDRFREWAEKTRAVSGQLPEIFRPFLEMLSAQLAIWDGDNERALEHLGVAKTLLNQSLIQVAQDNLGITSLHVSLAERYVEAGAADEALAYLDQVMKLFPAYGYGKLVQAKAHLANGYETEAARLLDDALAIWADADEAYLHFGEARQLRQEL